LDLGKVDW